MCGIFGWFGAPPADPIALFDTLSRMLYHRGPNDQGFEHDIYWGLGFRRLSILDLSESGHQPMSSFDKRYWIVFNGEIYNYVEIRKKMEEQGETFRGTSDTEVLLRLLMREGVNALNQLNGMFAFALVDTHERKFLLARDRFGKKPLYYLANKGHLRFASELKALLAWPDAVRRLNLNAVGEYLALSYLPHETCIFENYRKLPPGCYLSGFLDSPEKAATSSYWNLELVDRPEEGTISESDLEDLLGLLTNAVDIRLRSDVPVGIFLSGGIDSGLIASTAAQSKNSVRPLALTVSFAEDDFDEHLQAQITASNANLEHHVIKQPSSGLKDIDRLAWFYDEPFGDASALPMMTLCRSSSEYATVFLSGDGGDEVFGGYQRYINARKYAWLENVPKLFLDGIRLISNFFSLSSSIRYRMLKSSYPNNGMAAVFDGQGLAEDPALRAITHARLKTNLAGGGEPVWTRWNASLGAGLLTRQQALDFSLYLPDDILVKADRASMASSIELRSPFLDYRLVEWAARLPRSALLSTKWGKLPLRLIGEKLLPSKIQQGIKRGFGVPLNAWFRDPAGLDFVHERLLSATSSHRELVNIRGVKQLLLLHKKGRGRNFGEYIWRLLMLDAWARQYLDGKDFLNGPPS